MKFSAPRRHAAAGFSLMELVVVVAIIVVLAGLTLAGFNFVNQKNARSKATVQLKLLANAIENYQADNRSYPSHSDPNGERGDEVLYKALYWDIVSAGEGAGAPYLAELDPNNNTKGGQAWMQGTEAQARIVDPWGQPYRYRSGDAPGAINPDYDLWSVGPDGKTNSDPEHQDSKDDIRD